MQTPAKWPGRAAPSQRDASRPGTTRVSAPAGKLARRRQEEPVDAGFAAEPAVARDRARIAREVLARAELERIDEDARRHAPVPSSGEAHQGEVPFVQGAHGRNEADRLRRARARRERARIAFAPLTIRTRTSRGPWDSRPEPREPGQGRVERGRRRVRRARGRRRVRRAGGVRLLEARVAAGPHVVPEGSDRAADRVADLGVAPHEPRRLPEREPDQIVQHEHLAVALGAGADPDRGNRERARDLGTQLARDPRARSRRPRPVRARASSRSASAAPRPRACTR